MVHFLAALTLAASAIFSPPDQIEAVFQHTGDDSLGGAFSFALQQRMERSTLYRFTSDAKNSMRPAKVELELVSINVGTPKTGLISTVSLVAVVKCGSGPRIAHHALIVVSPDNLERMAQRTTFQADRSVSLRRGHLSSRDEPPSLSMVISATRRLHLLTRHRATRLIFPPPQSR